MKKGKFIVFEGIDGSGKSTISKMISEKMNTSVETLYTYEPTESMIGSLLREILTKKKIATEKTIGALFLADRLHHIENSENGMLQSINKGINIVCDRYYYSSYAYHVPHLQMSWVVEANSICAQLLRPDVVFYLQISVDEALKRIQESREKADLYESKDRMTQVKRNYETAIKEQGYKDNVIIINAEQEIDQVFAEVWKKVQSILE